MNLKPNAIIYCYFLSLIVISIMLLPAAQSLRVAVLGSGISGSTVARILADRGVQVTVFEAGRGIGGRTSTRITRDEPRYQFDHGAQYISKPKTELFQKALDQWKHNGWVKDWSVTGGGNFGTTVGLEVNLEIEKKERWVGFPAMHSICRNLLHHENIRVQLQTRADAIYFDNQGSNECNVSNNNEDKTPTRRWDLIHGKEKKHLGSFDWLIATDRNSGTHFRKDLASANVDEFRKGIRGIQSVKSLTAMVVFDKPLGLDLDGIQFDPKSSDGTFGSLGWAARDTSKPGRGRKDGKECWVLQSHPDAAKDILKGMKKIEEIREKAKDVLVADFLKSIPVLSGDENIQLPTVITAVGHRWGAAFPIPSQEYIDMDAQLIAEKKFVACGDYFGTLSGRIEGAYLSGYSAANQLFSEIEY